MTPEEQAAADAATAEAKAAEDATKAEKEKADAEFEAGLADLSDEEKEAKRTERKAAVDNKQIDYKAELKKETEAREKAEKALADKRFKDAQKKRKADDDAGDDPADSNDDAPVTQKDLAAVRAEARREVQAERALELATSLAGSEAEAQLLVAKWQNRTFPEGTPLSEQMEEVYAIVHRKQLIGERNEALRALKGKEGAHKTSASGHQDAPSGAEPKLSPADDHAIKAAGYVWVGAERAWVKQLANGDKLVKDAKTKIVKMVKKPKAK